MNSDDFLFEHKWHRQSGLLDQKIVSSLKITMEGHDESLLAMMLQLDLLGACRKDVGEVCIHRNPEDKMEIKMLRGLVDFDCNSWGEIQDTFSDRGMEVSLREVGKGEVDLWIGTANCSRPITHSGNWLIHGGGSAITGSGEFPEIDSEYVRETMIDAAVLICGVSALLHKLLGERKSFWETEVLDRWLTLTARVGNLDPEKAISRLNSRFGPGTATRTSDGEDSLVRWRVPLESTPFSLNEWIWQNYMDWDVELGHEDVGPFTVSIVDGSIKFGTNNLPVRLDEVNALVLGVGGLGSWAAPLLLSGCEPSTTRLNLIDGDQEIEVHNLNRQILYDLEDLGEAKASAAASRLGSRFEMGSDLVVGIPAPIGAHHIIDDSEELVDGEISLLDIIGDTGYDEVIEGSLDSMQIALSCLDNQNARTLLNRACLIRGVSMVNGGGEGVRGVIEHFGDGLCMVCRYGPQEAFAIERVSCQEEGTRPVSSIVTTTAYVGAMQAAMALCLLSAQRGHGNEVPYPRDWYNGKVSPRECLRLPWMEGECGGHL